MEFDAIRLKGQKTIDLPIFGMSPSTPYQLKAADGLGPPEANVNISMNANDFGTYQGRRPQGREIVLRVALNPNYSMSQTVAQLRSDLYGVVTPSSIDDLMFQLLLEDQIQAQTVGYVKNFEIVPFNKDPEVQITIACLSPYFQAAEMVHVEPEDLIDPIPGFVRVFNPGTAPSGVKFEIEVLQQRSQFFLWDEYGAEGPSPDPLDHDENVFLLYETSNPFLVGERALINTIPGQRDVTRTRPGDNYETVYNLVAAISPESTWWPMLHGGVNRWSFPSLNEDFKFLSFSFLPQYWGV